MNRSIIMTMGMVVKTSKSYWRASINMPSESVSRTTGPQSADMYSFIFALRRILLNFLSRFYQ
ncbi:MAG: hypothetical protein LZF62_70004 [Nitrospira sp.]|nr:MAG: hypothetical protein LZF62_70004 [Nitrospira sp.]